MNNGWHNKVIQHNSLEPFPLEDTSIDAVITSPPYWGLRDYGCNGQIGLEKHPSEYINHLVSVGKEIKRVLKKTGSFYLNLGDTYCGGGKNKPSQTVGKNNSYQYGGVQPNCNLDFDGGWLQPKQLMLIPVRVAIALQDDGWVLRNDIIWHKPNPMPSSVKDRLNCTFEHVFHFVKSRKYYYNLDMIREPHSSATLERVKYAFNEYKGDIQGGVKSSGQRVFAERLNKINQPYSVQLRHKPFVEIRDLPETKVFSKWLNKWRKKQKITIDKIESDMNSQAPHHWFNGESFPSVDDWKLFKDLYNPPTDYDIQLLNISLKPSEKINNPNGKNPGDVIKGGAILGETGAIKVPGGKGWTKKIPGGGNACSKDPRWCPPDGKNPGDVVNHHVYGEDKGNRGRMLDHLHQQGKHHHHSDGKNPGDFWDINTQPFTSFNSELEHFAVFPEELIIKPLKASCPSGGVVLDPFCGRGTVGKVAKQLGLNYVLFDVKPEYCKLARLYVNGQKRKIIEHQQELKFGVGS